MPSIDVSLIQEITNNNIEELKTINEQIKAFPSLKLEKNIGSIDLTFEKRSVFSDYVLFFKNTYKENINLSICFDLMLNCKTKPFFIINKLEQLENIMIAWDASIEASRALYSALPILNKAKNIYLYSVGKLNEEIESIEFENIIEKLKEFNSNIIPVKIDKSANIGKDIVEFSKTNKIDLLIAGAYHHSKAAEFLFGGVTKYLIDCQDSPSILFSH